MFWETEGTIPLPASVEVRDPYLFPITNNAVDYEAPQNFRRAGDELIEELQATGAPRRFRAIAGSASAKSDHILISELTGEEKARCDPY